MEKVIIDTCFLSKFKIGANFSGDFELLMNEMDYEVFIHPYILKYELDVFYFVEEYINKGVLKILKYDDFLLNEFDRMYYQENFIEIYNEFCERQESLNPIKADKMKKLESETDIFKCKKGGASLGDVHVIMLALFEDIPIILSEDNKDMIEIYKIASKRINRENYMLKIYKVEDIIEELDNRDNCEISHKDLKKLKRIYCKNR